MSGHSGPGYYAGVRTVERRNVTTDLQAALEEAVPELRRLERRWLARGVPLYGLDLRRHRQLAEKLLAILQEAP
jgi:hypothetical protein